MFKTRKLAYGDGNTEIERPRVIKRLGFSGMALLLTMSNCAPAQALTRDRTGEYRLDVRAPRPAPAQRPAPQARSQCMPDMEPLGVRSGERRLETACAGGREFVLTESNLYIRTRQVQGDAEDSGAIRLLARVTITDISGYAAQGIVHWQPMEDSVIIITRSDRRLTILPDEGMGDTVPSFQLPFETAEINKQRVAYQSGFLFIAPQQGDVLVMSFGDHAGSAFLSLRSDSKRDCFTLRGARLFFGRDEHQTEIRIRGPSVGDVGPIL